MLDERVDLFSREPSEESGVGRSVNRFARSENREMNVIIVKRKSSSRVNFAFLVDLGFVTSFQRKVNTKCPG